MQMKFYCDLYVSECWQEKRARIIKKLKQNRIQPQVYVVALSQGSQNQLEFFSSILLKQHVFDNTEVFVVGIANGYDEALLMVRDITEQIYTETGTADLRKYILERQEEYVKAGQ
ncbi:MAG TPA: hypothetical protein H9756_04295 [Candidatus Mediterraneibacter gallistercoris]|uniref:Uncharacterized protein n=1 Tax=Candidatus Mediterraneibacter gallistercoris TaxID=2838671 RepID=A0A9D2P4W2_9FIRM|nr:hypothetical protein [Candidatus Mediterraneibacter gallistercoris]